MIESLNKNNDENIVAEVVFISDDKKYKCIGVLIKNRNGTIRVAFTAKNNDVQDYLDIKQEDILNINIISPSEIVEI